MLLAFRQYLSTATTSGTGGGGSTSTLTTLSLNHFNVADGAQVFPDEITGVTWTYALAGTAEGDTAQAKFGSASVLLPNALEQWVQATGWSDPVSGDWSYETFVRWDDGAAAAAGFNFYDVAAQLCFSLRVDQAGLLNASIRTTDGFTNFNLAQTQTVAIDTWYHMGAVRDGANNVYNFLWNGNRVQQYTQSLDITSMLTLELINDNNGNVWYDESRFVIGIAYTGATYIVPTGEFSP